jgi:hypothetical protein
MAERMAFVIIGTGTDPRGPIHCRAWEVPPDEEVLGEFAATMTAAYGDPAEWVSDETGHPGQPQIVLYDAG